MKSRCMLCGWSFEQNQIRNINEHGKRNDLSLFCCTEACPSAISMFSITKWNTFTAEFIDRSLLTKRARTYFIKAHNACKWGVQIYLAEPKIIKIITFALIVGPLWTVQQFSLMLVLSQRESREFTTKTRQLFHLCENIRDSFVRRKKKWTTFKPLIVSLNDT